MPQKKRSEMTPQELEAARERAAHARSVFIQKFNAGQLDMSFPRKRKKVRATSKPVQEEAKPAEPSYSVADFNELVKYAQFLQGQVEALNAKVANLEHKAIQYQAVISYLETTK
jgi:hypothetical protein